MKPVREIVTVPFSMREIGEVEELQLLDAGKSGFAQHGEGGRTLQRQAGDGFGFFFDMHVEADGAVEQPRQMPLLAAQPELFGVSRNSVPSSSTWPSSSHQAV